MRSLALSAFVGLGLLSWIACVGSDPAPAPAAQGARGERCFDNGTCIAGLGCVAGKCEVTSGGEGGTTPPASTTDADAAADAGVDAPPPCIPWYDGGASSVRCGDTACVHDDVCCNVNNAISCQGSDNCALEDVVWSCEAKFDCSFGTSVCCVTGTPATGASCPAALDHAVSRCMDVSECVDAGHDFIACESSAECSTGHCAATEVHTTGGFTIIQKICQP